LEIFFPFKRSRFAFKRSRVPFKRSRQAFDFCFQTLDFSFHIVALDFLSNSKLVFDILFLCKLRFNPTYVSMSTDSKKLVQYVRIVECTIGVVNGFHTVSLH